MVVSTNVIGKAVCHPVVIDVCRSKECSLSLELPVPCAIYILKLMVMYGLDEYACCPS